MAYRLFILIVLSTVIMSCQPGQNRADLPVAEVQALTEDFNGIAGVYVKDLVTGSSFEINADTVFPTASMIKVPILVTLFDKIEKGELEYLQEFEYDPEHAYSYSSDIISNQKEGSVVPLFRLIHLMMSTSNNTASIWNQHLAGTGTEINEWLGNNGFVHTRMNSGTPGRDEAFSEFGWGQTTPREMATLLENIYNGEAVSPHASEQMYRIMTRNFWDGKALSRIPPYVNVASKNGSVRRSKSEVLLVNASSGDYLFCIITKNQEDISNEYENEGWQLIRDISGILYRHFEPADNWQPNPERVRTR